MWILWLLISALMIFLIVMLSKNVAKNRLSAREILDLRYANGEIDEAEYNKRKQLLEN